MNVARALQPLAFLLAPVLVVQARRVRRNTPRLPAAAEPAGTVPGEAGDAPPPIRLAVFGDSTGAGVGVDRHENALAGRLAAAVAERTGRQVSWRAVARSGATSLTARELVPGLVAGSWRPDVVVVVIGVNDLKNLRRLRSWDRDLPALLGAIGEAVPEARTVVSGMAPVGRFPSLPQPMRAVMGLRSRAMDHVLRRIAGRTHVPIDPAMVRDGFFAEDGFHPSAAGYRHWADHLAPAVTAAL